MIPQTPPVWIGGDPYRLQSIGKRSEDQGCFSQVWVAAHAFQGWSLLQPVLWCHFSIPLTRHTAAGRTETGATDVHHLGVQRNWKGCNLWPTGIGGACDGGCQQDGAAACSALRLNWPSRCLTLTLHMTPLWTLTLPYPHPCNCVHVVCLSMSAWVGHPDSAYKITATKQHVHVILELKNAANGCHHMSPR
mmetsp:Transcript_32261/g.57883  ORF Transcript_32261/g.57883 Transcript_32261/m.57883 type:complete len:191 (-) Transcript_32261:85-657(-)